MERGVEPGLITCDPAAGYETTANTLAFTTYCLATNPDKAAKLMQVSNCSCADACSSGAPDTLPLVLCLRVHHSSARDLKGLMRRAMCTVLQCSKSEHILAMLVTV